MKEYKYKIDGKEYVVSIDNVTEGSADVIVNGESYQVEFEATEKPKKKVVLGNAGADNAAAESSESTAANVNTANAVKAPLPGVITEIKVAVGDAVKAGDTVIVLEAMKMANNIEAEKDGVVSAICVKQGENVMEETPLVVID